MFQISIISFQQKDETFFKKTKSILAKILPKKVNTNMFQTKAIFPAISLSHVMNENCKLRVERISLASFFTTFINCACHSIHFTPK